MSNLDQEIKVTKAQLLRVIEQLKASGADVNPITVSRAMDISRSVFYSDLELLDSIYRYGSKPSGADIVIQELVVQLKSQKRKVTKLEKKILEAEMELEKSYSEGFSKGAALNYNKKEANLEEDFSYISSEKEEGWAKGVLFLKPEEELSLEKIKSAYRRLIQLMHPDKSGAESNELVHALSKAYELLLNKYS